MTDKISKLPTQLLDLIEMHEKESLNKIISVADFDAKLRKQIMSVYVENGFTEEQAFELMVKQID
jgi:hypothetical protein